jgi:hypothetical protein
LEVREDTQPHDDKLAKYILYAGDIL